MRKKWYKFEHYRHSGLPTYQTTLQRKAERKVPSVFETEKLGRPDIGPSCWSLEDEATPIGQVCLMKTNFTGNLRHSSPEDIHTGDKE